jgi:Domain of unknown function (DUF4153)
MSLTTRIDRLIPDLIDTLKRFPVCVLAALAVFIDINIWLIGNSAQQRFVLAGCAVFLASGAGHLIGEGRGRFSLVLALVMGLAAGVLVYFDQVFHTSQLFLFGGLVPVLMLAPFMRTNAKQGALWLFNMRLGLAILLAVVVGVVFGLGVSAIVAGMDYLLGIKLDYNIYERVWALALALVGPIYGLSLVPRDVNEEIDLALHRGSLLERGVSVLVSYVMVPLALIYAVILHAYALKIMFIGELPKGQIGTIVSLFAVGGTATWLIGWPWRDTGTKLLRWFMRGWFWLLPVPAVLLSLAIWRRVSDYGVTPHRYGIALVAVWTAVVFGYLVLRRNRADMRVVLGSAAVLLLVGSFGPQGAFGVTGASQFARLKGFLEAKGVLKDGKIVVDVPPMLDTNAKTISSMLSSLREANALGQVEKLVGQQANETTQVSDPYGYTRVSEIEHKLGVNLMIVAVESVSFNAELPIDQKWQGSTRLIGPFTVANYNLRVASGGVLAVLSDKDLRIGIDGRENVLRSHDVMNTLKSATSPDLSKTPMVPIVVDKNLTLLVSQALGNAGAGAKITSITFWIVLHE